ncbi:MAG: hypothetical protein ACEQSH_00870 [Bacteroidia bacterium]
MREKGTQMRKKAKAQTIQAEKGETEADTMARVMVSPFMRHGILAHASAGNVINKLPGDSHFDDDGRALQVKAKVVAEGDLSLVSEMLTTQALALDSLFTELGRGATMNLGDCPLAAERYGRLALQAQSNSRAALEASAELHQPRVRTVRHVHVNEGGPAVIADHFHDHLRDRKFVETSEQSHATRAAGERPTLSSADATGNGMPIPNG